MIYKKSWVLNHDHLAKDLYKKKVVRNKFQRKKEKKNTMSYAECRIQRRRGKMQNAETKNWEKKNKRLCPNKNKKLRLPALPTLVRLQKTKFSPLIEQNPKAMRMDKMGPGILPKAEKTTISVPVERHARIHYMIGVR